jgi:CubicO group peptidase (beta-lactamase class C family)
MNLRFSLLSAIVGLSVLYGSVGQAQEFPYALFERYIEPLRLQSGIPGLSAAVVRDGKIEWEKGFGFADIEKSIAAAPDTPYPIGGITEAMTGVLIGICADRHLLEVDDAIRKFAPRFPADATVRQVMAHGSEGRFVYDPSRYSQLTAVVETCLDRSYRAAVVSEILNRLALNSSAPGLSLGSPGSAERELFDAPTLARYSGIVNRVAKPYSVDAKGKATLSNYGAEGIDAATGMVSTVRDLAKFDIELQRGTPLSTSTLTQMWSPALFVIPGANGQSTTLTLPTGLGWFVQLVSKTEPLVWSFGNLPNAGSALIVKVPAKNSTLILLANSHGLAVGANLERADVTASPFVKTFLRLFL